MADVIPVHPALEEAEEEEVVVVQEKDPDHLKQSHASILLTLMKQLPVVELKMPLANTENSLMFGLHHIHHILDLLFLKEVMMPQMPLKL